MRLSCEALAKTYSGREGEIAALDGVDLYLDDGEFVSIVGPSGCGKSTLFNILCGLLRPTGGRIAIDGRETGDLLGRIGYMPQKDLLMPWRTVLDNVILGLEPVCGAKTRVDAPVSRSRALGSPGLNIAGLQVSRAGCASEPRCFEPFSPGGT